MKKAPAALKTKAQSAMEYLRTYGWAILIIAVVLGALFQLGVFNSSSFSPRVPPGACQVFRPSGPGTVANINLMGVCTGQLPQYVSQFNGNSYILGGAGASITSIGTMTVLVWINSPLPTQVYGPQVIENLDGCLTNGYFLAFGTLGGGSSTLHLISGTGGSSAGQYDFTNVFVPGKWYQVGFVWTSTGAGSSTQQLYINGNIDKQRSIGIGVPAPRTAGLQIGKETNCWNPAFFTGQMANIQIYNTSLSANEVQALYLEGIGGAPMLLQNLAGWWPLNGDAKDYSGNNNNGVPTAVSFTSQYGK